MPDWNLLPILLLIVFAMWDFRIGLAVMHNARGTTISLCL